MVYKNKRIKKKQNFKTNVKFVIHAFKVLIALFYKKKHNILHKKLTKWKFYL